MFYEETTFKVAFILVQSLFDHFGGDYIRCRKIKTLTADQVTTILLKWLSQW